MNQENYNALISSLDHAVEILSRHRTPDGPMVAAYDTVKQARALVAKAVTQPKPAEVTQDELMAAA
jgi:hypothetical protein